MKRVPAGLDEIRRVRRQRNLFAALAVLAIAAIGFGVPRKVQSYRELKSANARLVELQLAIVANQDAIRDTQSQILEAQKEITQRITR